MAEPGQARRAEAAGSGRAAGAELSPCEVFLQALPGRRRGRSEARQRVGRPENRVKPQALHAGALEWVRARQSGVARGAWGRRRRLSMVWPSITKRCGAGCGKRVCGRYDLSASRTAHDGRRRRTRGVLLPLDGSHHRWLQQRGP